MKSISMKQVDSKLSLEQIHDFEKMIGASLPEAYKQFLLKYNGGRTEEKRFPLIDAIEDDEENGCDFSLGWFYAINKEEYCNLIYSYKNDSGSEIPKEFLIINDGISGHHYICLGIEGEHRGELYLRASDNYMYKIADNFTDFINSLYKFEILDLANEDETMVITNFVSTHDRYSLPYSTEVKKYGAIVTDFLQHLRLKLRIM
jgi:hypothetical protein